MSWSEKGLSISGIFLLNVWAFAVLWGIYDKHNPDLFTESECRDILKTMPNYKPLKR